MTFAGGTARDAAMADWLAGLGHDPSMLRPLAGDASNRRYLRLPGAVVMDAPPARGESVGAFLAITRWLRSVGLSAPEVLAAEPGRGFLLLEDLGDDLFARVALSNAALERELYEAAVDLLADLARQPVPARIEHQHGSHELGPYDHHALGREAGLAVEWYLAGAAGPTSADLDAEFDALVRSSVAGVAEAREVIVLRDYHAENLLWLPRRSGPARVGLLDYQDALSGHAAYDLVSLLEDARRDTAPALRDAMIRRYLDRSGRPADEFRAAYAALGAQRNLKIIGIFARLCLRDGKPQYLRLLPRVWDHLMRDLSHPALAPLAAWVARVLPPPDSGLIGRLAAACGRGNA